MALFKRPSAYQEANGESGGGGTALMEAEAPEPQRSVSPFIAELEALDRDAEELARLLKESVELDAALRRAEQAAAALAQRLEEMKTPVGLATSTDEELREAASQLVQMQRTVGGCQLACERFRTDHGDLFQRKQRLAERRERVQRDHAQWELTEDFFDIAADLEDALSRLAAWESRRTGLNRTGGIVLPALTAFDDFPSGGPLTEGKVHRNFKFLRRLYGRVEADERDVAMEKSVALFRERGQMPTSLFIGWR